MAWNRLVSRNRIPLHPAVLPRRLVEATGQAANAPALGRLATSPIITASVATLTEGVLRTMVLTKLTFAAAACLSITIGAAVLVSQATAQKPAGQANMIDRLSTLSQAADQSATRDDELDVAMLERAWVDAIPRRDAAVVRRVLADDFEGINLVGQRLHQGNLHDRPPQRHASRRTRSRWMRSGRASSARPPWSPAGSRSRVPRPGDG